jgi:DMSO/TMAO reductase YedYZ heme-binding membrane subunit
MLAAVDPKLWWYVSRASGLVSWMLLALAVLWGLLLSTKALSKSAPPAWLLGLHRYLGCLAVIFVLVHMGALTLDDYAPFSLRDLLVPMASSWKPGAVAWGVTGFYLLVAIEITSLLGRRFPKNWWRRVHALSFPLFVVATVHLFVAGTERNNQVVIFSTVIVSTVVFFLIVVRLLARYAPRAASTSRVPAAARSAARRSDVGPDALPERAPITAPSAEPNPLAAASGSK